MFNATRAANLFLSDRETFDETVAPLLSEDMRAEVAEIVAEREVERARESLKRALVTDTSDDDADGLYRAMSDLSDDMAVLVRTRENGVGKVTRTVRVLTPNGWLKAVLSPV